MNEGTLKWELGALHGNQKAARPFHHGSGALLMRQIAAPLFGLSFAEGSMIVNEAPPAGF